MREFDAAELKDHLENCATPPCLLDVRQPWEFEICHIKDSKLIPMSQVQTRAHELDPDNETVVICHHGIRSYSVACLLDQLGFKNVINLKGGIDQWAKTVDPSMPTY